MGPIECESACDCIECMDKAEVPSLYEFMTLLLSDCELLDSRKLDIEHSHFSTLVVHGSSCTCGQAFRAWPDAGGTSAPSPTKCEP